MVDPIRHDLIQVVRRCGKLDCVLTQPMINKILNGKFQEVINDYAKSPKVRVDTIDDDSDVVDVPQHAPEEPVHPDEDDQNDEPNVPTEEVIRNEKFF